MNTRELELSPHLPVMINDIHRIFYKNKVPIDAVKNFLIDFTIYYYETSQKQLPYVQNTIYNNVFNKLYEHTKNILYKNICDQLVKYKKNKSEHCVKIIMRSFYERIQEITLKAKQYNFKEYIQEYNEIIMYFAMLANKFENKIITVEVNTHCDDVFMMLHYNNYIGVFQILTFQITHTQFMEKLTISKGHLIKMGNFGNIIEPPNTITI